MDASSTFNESMNSDFLNSSITIGYDSNSSAHINQSAEFFDIEPPPPAIQALLNSNEAPLHSQMLQSNLRDAQITLSNLEVCLDSMNTEIALLTTKRDQIITTIKTYRDVLHPIRRTPPEVLIEIFSYCVPFVDTMSPDICRTINSLNTKSAPWTFGQVCKHWRSIVLECPRLWSSLSLNVDKYSSANSNLGRQIECRAIDLLTHYLLRSKDCPLTIAVHSAQISSPILSIICSHSARWTNVLLSLRADAFPFLSIIKGRLPRLKNLHLHNTTAWDNRIPAIDVFEYAPNLYLIRSSEIPQIATNLILPWDKILVCLNMFPTGSVRRVERDSINRDNIQLLSQTVKLRRATLMCWGSGRSLSVTSLTHRSLSVLTITLVHRSNPGLLDQLLDALTLPSLSSLQFTASSRQPVRPGVHCIVRLVERSRCPLSKLRLKGIETDVDQDPHLLSLLSVLPLEMLCLDVFPDSLLNALMVTGDEESEPPLLPRLRDLRAMGSDSSYLDEELFVDMVESRVRHANLKALTMHPQYVLTDRAQARLDSQVLDIKRDATGSF
ncbi:hypothetical protein EV360DRAFT_82552 [Lentinula raphanica]|nr:hypothetical protein EV360DRAFT_82552 [Lentinula raphanica]